jgi:endonuclease/exonuclease/phosphatase family metal-dependent hydrolase
MASLGRVWRRVFRPPPRRVSVWVLVVVAVGVGIGVGAVVWPESGDTRSRREQFVDAYAAGLAGTAMSGEDARCWARASVDAIGPATLAEATSPEATRANPPLVASELGLSVDESQGEAFYKAVRGCMDTRQFVSLVDGVDAECVSERIADALLRELVVAWFTSTPEMSSDASAGLAELYESCPAEPGGDQSPPAPPNIARFRSVQEAGPKITVMSYNVRGLLRTTAPTYAVDSDMRRFTQIMGDEVARRKADFVLLQEVCGGQAELIAQRSSGRGHPMSVIAVATDLNLDVESERPDYADALTWCPGEDPPFGQPFPYGRAILAHLPNAVPIEPPTGADPERPPLCVRAESPRPMRVCNVHTEHPRTRSIPGPFRQWAEAEPLILGGDFNTQPLAEPMPSLYSFMHEATSVGCRPPERVCSPLYTAHTPVLYKTIDYIFVDDAHFTAPLPRQRLGDVLPMRCTGVWHEPPLGTWCSDHGLVLGEFTLSSTESQVPPQIDPSVHGGSAWAVYLAVAGYDDPRIAEAETAARSVGYDAAASDLGCDVGAAEQLGEPLDDELEEEPDQQVDDGLEEQSGSFAAAVAVYFADEANAREARELFERRGVPVVGVANISFICVDGA